MEFWNEEYRRYLDYLVMNWNVRFEINLVISSFKFNVFYDGRKGDASSVKFVANLVKFVTNFYA